MGDKRHGPGSSFAMLRLLARRTKYGFPDLPGLPKKIDKNSDSLLSLITSNSLSGMEFHRTFVTTGFLLILKCSYTHI